MVDTVEEILNPLFLVTFIFGRGILRYPLDQPKYHLNIFYMLTVWSVYACGVYYINFQYSIADIFPSYLTAFMIIINLFITMISIIVTVRKHKKFHLCLKKLDHVNDTLEEFGTLKEYHSLRNWIKWTLIIWILITCAMWIFDSLMFVRAYNDKRAVIIPIIINFTIHINSIMDIIVMVLLRYIGSRLDTVSNYIVQLSETGDCGLRYKWKKSLAVNSHYVRNSENCKRILWIVIHLHLELCRIVRDINGFFGMQMTLQMLSYFIYLTATFIFQYNTILNLKKLYRDDIAVKFWISCNTWFTILKLISLNHICESASVKARKTKDVVHRLTNLIRFDKLREEISQFASQILLLPLQFSGLGMFYFGYSFVRKFFIWIITTVLFMVQIGVRPAPQKFDKYNTTYYHQK